MKTDPRNSDYIVEAGASRNFEPWRDKDEEIDKKKEAEELGDAMKSLENRSLDSKREMDIVLALDEMQSIKSRHAAVSVDDMLKALQRTGEDDEDEDPDMENQLDEAVIKSIFHAPEEFVKRIDDEGDDNNSSEENIAGNSVKRQKVFEDIKNSELSSSKPMVKIPAIAFKVKKKDKTNNDGS